MRTVAELQRLGWQALVKELGLADALRYQLLFQPGQGDYVAERRTLFAGATVDDLLAELAKWEKGRPHGDEALEEPPPEGRPAGAGGSPSTE